MYLGRITVHLQDGRRALRHTKVTTTTTIKGLSDRYQAHSAHIELPMKNMEGTDINIIKALLFIANSIFIIENIFSSLWVPIWVIGIL